MANRFNIAKHLQISLLKGDDMNEYTGDDDDGDEGFAIMLAIV